MKYAVISDIHGNMPALNAVLEDCKNHNIDKYIFLGDYFGEFPLPNEVIKTIKSINNSYTIKGNKESRLVYFKSMNSDRRFEQLAPLYWNLDNISNTNYEFIMSLPEIFSFTDNNINFYLAHSPSQHFGFGITDNICGRTYVDDFGKHYTNHNEYLNYAKNIINSNSDFVNTISNIPDGIYLFGHYHTQWYANIKGKLLINPGSCGLPLDFETTAPYTIIDNTDNNLSIIERRIKYDIEKSVKILKESDFYNVAPFWNKLSLMEFKNARVTILFFLEFVEQLATIKNDKSRPYSNELWQEAIEKYTNKLFAE